MSNFTPRPNTGNLFRIPDEKRKSENFPQYDGEFLVTCPHCQAEAGGWISGWVRDAKNGAKFFSLAFKFKQRMGGAQ